MSLLLQSMHAHLSDSDKVEMAELLETFSKQCSGSVPADNQLLHAGDQEVPAVPLTRMPRVRLVPPLPPLPSPLPSPPSPLPHAPHPHNLSPGSICRSNPATRTNVTKRSLRPFKLSLYAHTCNTHVNTRSK